MEKIMELIGSPIGIFLVAVLIIVIILKRSADLAAFILSLMKQSKDKDLALAADFCVGIFLFVEKMIPDDAENKTARKTDLALKEFIKAWDAAKGKSPDDQLKEWARGCFANLAFDHKAGRRLRSVPDNS